MSSFNESEDPTKIEITFDPLVERMRAWAAHGGQYFDVPYMSQIDGNLWQGGCANGLLLPDHIEHVISLYPWERYTVKHELKSFLEVRMYDSTQQAFDQVKNIAYWVAACVKNGPTLVHCQAGLNRSSLVATTAMWMNGMAAQDAVALVRKQRSSSCLCNGSFEEWVLALDTKDLPEPDDARVLAPIG